MALEIFELYTVLSAAADCLDAIIYSCLRLLGFSEEKARNLSEVLVIILFCVILIGAVYAAIKYL